MKKTAHFFFIFFIPFAGFSQSGKSLLNDSILHEIRIQINVPNWFAILEDNFRSNLSKPESVPEVYLPCTAIIDGKIIDSIGMREKGNYSNSINKDEKKKPFKLAFDAFRDQKFNGLKKINLNNGTDDPGFSREALAYKLMRGESIPTPRTSFARFYINDEYWGVYELVENVDKTFLKDHYGAANNDGNLYKTDRGAAVTLQWLGSDTAKYIETGLLYKSNDSIHDWTRMLTFIDIINNAKPDEMKEKLGAVFDVESYLSVLAVEKLIFSWDSYWGGGNNFYLYEHPDGKIRWIPWDFNESFQKNKWLVGALLPEPDYLIPTDRFDKRPLLKAIFSVPEWRSLYLDKVCDIISNRYSADSLAPVLIRWHEQIADAWLEDPNKLDPYPDFDVSLTQETVHNIDFPRTGFAFHIKLPGMLPFIAEQSNWAVQQLEENNYSCSFTPQKNTSYSLGLFPNPTTTEVTLTWEEDRLDVSQVIILDVTGTPVSHSKWCHYPGRELKLELPQLAPGFYIIKKLDADGKYGIGKLVKL
jgi:hypothetical protein